jgi:serine/threonine protein kinase/Flp pilus assembly protein TadD
MSSPDQKSRLDENQQAANSDLPKQIHKADGVQDDPQATQIERPVDDPNATLPEDSKAADDFGETVIGSSEAALDATLIKDGAAQAKDPHATVIEEPKGSPAAIPSGQRRYELIANFARGGLGKIWKAEDTRIRREVAYKELLPNALKNPAMVERFLEEAQITGQLEHPGIVPIYDLGRQDDGTPFYSMKLVRGITLKDAIRNFHSLPRENSARKLAFVKLLRTFVDVCNALAFAHERGVLHRDLKPLNIMLGDFGETLVLDWGLAKLMADEQTEVSSADDAVTAGSESGQFAQPAGDTSQSIDEKGDGPKDDFILAEQSHVSASFRQRHSVSTDARSEGSETLAGSIMGTPGYMPPEQALGQLQELDARTDNYALGAVLYEILTDRPPIPQGKVAEMLNQIVTGTIVPPRVHDPTIPRQLEAIALKALSKAKRDRYPTALELAHDVEAYIADEPVSAYPEPWHLRLRRWLKRHRTLVTTTAAMLCVIVAGLFAWNWMQSRRIDGIRMQAKSNLAESQQAAEEGDFAKSNQLLNQAAGLIEAEESLTELRQLVAAKARTLRQSIAAEEAQRLAGVRLDAEKKIAAANSAVELGRFDAATNILTEVVTILADEPKLSELETSARFRLKQVDHAIALRKAEEAAYIKFRKFLDQVDQARFQAGRFMRHSAVEDSQEAQKYALAALRMYNLEGADPLKSPPEQLSDEQLSTLQHDAFEMMLIVAETGFRLASRDDVEQQQAAAARSLEWTAKAKALGIETRSLHRREAAYLQTLGKQPDRAIQAAEAMTPSTALDFYLLAQTQRAAGQFEQALILYEQALRIDPDHFWALQNVGLCHQRLLRFHAAVAAYNACVAHRPEEPRPYLTRAIAYAYLKQFDRALADVNKAMELDPNLMEVYLNRGFVYVQQQRYTEAVADFKRAATMSPDRANPLINLGETYRRQGKYQNALVTLTKAAGLSPDEPRVYRIRGDVQMHLEATDLALQDFQRAIRLARSPSLRAEIYKQIGAIHHLEGEMQQALAAYDNSLHANPRDADVIRFRAEALLALNRDQEAIEAFSDFLKKSQPVGDVYRARGLAKAKLGRYRESINDYTRSLELEPAPHILTRRGWAYLLQANRLALQDFDEAIKLDPDDADSYGGRGYAKVMLGNYSGAVADAEEAIERSRKQVARQGTEAWPLIYNPATIFALAVPLVAKDTRRPAEVRAELATKFTTRAVELLEESLTVAGPKHKAIVMRNINTDPALDPLRNRPEFQKAFKPPKPPRQKARKRETQ